MAKTKTKPATKKSAPAKPAKPKPAKPPKAGPKQPPGGLPAPEVQFPGRIEIDTPGGPVLEDLPMHEAIPAESLFAARLAAAELQPHLYIAHRSLDRQVTVLAYAEVAALGEAVRAELRVPQRGAWLWCPADGTIFLLTSPRLLTYEGIVELVDGRAPGPRKIDDDNG